MRIWFDLNDGSVRNENNELVGFIVQHSIQASFREKYGIIADVRFDFDLKASVFSRDMQPQKVKPKQATAELVPSPKRIRSES